MKMGDREPIILRLDILWKLRRGPEVDFGQ